MAQSFGARNASGGATLSVSPSAATTAGDLLVATIRIRNGNALSPVSSVADTNATDHWVRAAVVTQGLHAEGDIWYAANAASLSTSQKVTVTVGGTSASTSAIAFTVLDVTGASTSPLDVTATKTGSAASVSTGTTATTAQASEIAVAGIGWNGTATPSGQTAGYTITPIQTATAAGAATGEQASWKILTATGAQTYGATLSEVTWTGAIATFKLRNPTPLPTITGFSPTSGMGGTSVVITGTGFTGASAVAFNGTAATYAVTDDSDITASVPAGATTGTIRVTTPGGFVDSSATFTVNTSPPPTITSFNPTSGVVGTSVVITGSGFTGATAVAFNGTSQPTYTVDNDTQITTTVPSGATTGTIRVTTPGAFVDSSASFTVNPSPAPTITSFNPTSGSVGTSVVITGTGFTGASAVAFNVASATYKLTDDSNISTSVPAGATSGPITVTTPGGAVTSSASFTVNSPPTPHVMVIVEENKGYTSTLGTPLADPYYSSLANAYASGTSWYGVSHPSLPAYLAMISGSTQGQTTDCTTCGPFPGSDLGTQLSAANIPWTAYMETMPSACYTGGKSGTYVKKHDPFVYMASDLSGPCATNVLPYPGVTSMLNTLNGPGAPDFVWITPNDLDNMHDGTVQQGDAWLQANLGPVLASPWFTSGNATVIVTMDEHSGDNTGVGDGAGGHIPMVIISNASAGKGGFATPGNLYGILRSIEEAYGLPLLGKAANPLNGDVLALFG
ncbi:MAG: IPT/TIG domain-containing protein [Candidatus Dormibacteraeota bacterium]|nr:IPT/TIG domain-containing protein [Candidatus Dormibacteraeota bacterium]